MLGISEINEADSCPQVKQKQHEGINIDRHETTYCNMKWNYEASTNRSWLLDFVWAVKKLVISTGGK